MDRATTSGNRHNSMGLTYVTVEARSLSGKRKGYAAEFLVDTCAMDCLAPGDQLRKAGIRPEGTAVYELANGEPVEYEYGYARLKFMGEDTIARVIFGPEDVEPLLGVLALESTGIIVDPRTRELKRLPVRPLKLLTHLT